MSMVANHRRLAAPPRITRPYFEYRSKRRFAGTHLGEGLAVSPSDYHAKRLAYLVSNPAQRSVLSFFGVNRVR